MQELMSRRQLLILATVIVCLFVTVQSYGWQGKVVGVSDGDTITVMHEGRGEKIRLYGVDCPESHQDFGAKAKEFTSTMVFSKIVDVEPIVADRYGRTVGIVSLDGQCLDEALLKAGLAWVYTQYCTKPVCHDWGAVESRAKEGKIGLWSMPAPIPPWEFRHPTGKTPERVSQVKAGAVAVTQESALYRGNTSSHIFHNAQCRYFNCNNCTAVFETRDDAIKNGYRPCKICNP